jgi:hypothetical protein
MKKKKKDVPGMQKWYKRPKSKKAAISQDGKAI